MKRYEQIKESLTRAMKNSRLFAHSGKAVPMAFRANNIAREKIDYIRKAMQDNESELTDSDIIRFALEVTYNRCYEADRMERGNI